jgi:hypothetical protein
MAEEEYITLAVELNQDGKKVGLNISIKDGFAVFNFTDPNLALKWYEGAKATSGKDGVNVHYSKKINAVIYEYEFKLKEEIKEILIEEMKQYGGK